jgi:hypothetical protein
VPTAPSTSSLRQSRRPLAGPALLAAVLLGHALLLGAWPDGAEPARPGASARALQWRVLQPATPPPSHAEADPAPAAQPPTRPASAADPAPAPAADPAPAPEATAAADGAPQPALMPAAAPDLGLAQAPELPLYATRLPPPLTLRYRLRRGRAEGQAELRWLPGATGYGLSLDHRITAGPAQRATSAGLVEAQGLAPARYAEGSRGRERRAVNFQRDRGRITFSGPALEYPLPAGAQDRLSWMVQLAGIVAADPALARAGREILLYVAGVRGDAEVWRFQVGAPEDVEVAGTAVRALHLRRQARGLYDPEIEVWLDPERHHLPARVLMNIPATGAATELNLLGAEPP